MLQKQEAVINFDAFLQEALTRNSTQAEKEKYKVIFILENYIDDSNSLWEKDSKNPLLPENMLTYGYNPQDIEKNNNSNNYAPAPLEDDWASNTWNFRTPQITTNSYLQVNDNCAWIFFEPCIILSLEDTPKGEMFLGKTPIYDDSSQLSS